jgi:hypothetical protein
MLRSSAVLLFCTSAFVLFPHPAASQQFSAVMVDADAHGDTTRTPFYVGDDKVRWTTMHGADAIGGVILDVHRRTLTALDDGAHTYYSLAGDDAASEMGELFLIMRPTDLRDPCRGWNAAASSDAIETSQGPHFTCRSLGADTVGGRATQKWELTYVRTGKKGYAWLDPQLRYLVRMQDAETGSTMEVRKIAEGRQPAALFTVPQGYHKLESPPQSGDVK